MADARITQLIAEALAEGADHAQVTQLVAEALAEGADHAQVTQLVVEAIALEPEPIPGGGWGFIPIAS